MVNDLHVLIRYFETVVNEDIDKVEQEIKDKAVEFNVLRIIVEPTPEEESKAYTIANKVLNLGIDIVHHKETKEALKILDDILYPNNE